jgi:hypothetical protein
VIRYIEDIADSVAGESRNGEIEFEELDLAFRQAHRSRAAAQYEKAGRAAMHKLELLLRMREISIVQWFNEVGVGKKKTRDNNISNNFFLLSCFFPFLLFFS